MIIAIDPGPVESGWLLYSCGQVFDFNVESNEKVLHRLVVDLNPNENGHLVIEMVASYGMSVGAHVFETVYWIGRFVQAWDGPHSRLYRKDIKVHLCNSVKAKDGNIRQALLDRFGGTQSKAKGTKTQPGPLYGVSGHIWSALALAVTFEESRKPDVRVL